MDLPVDYYTLDAISQRSGVPTQCIERSAQTYNVPKSLMYAVLVVESGKEGTRSKNTNDTFDLGPAQINTIWLKELGKRGYTEKDLQHNGCKNIEAASWIMGKALDSSGDLWVGIARYHSKREPSNFTYRLLIYRALNNIKRSNE